MNIIVTDLVLKLATIQSHRKGKMKEIQGPKTKMKL